MKSLHRSLIKTGAVGGLAAAMTLSLGVATAPALTFNPNAKLDTSQVQDRRCINYVCLFKDANYVNEIWRVGPWSTNTVGFSVGYVGSNINDETTSIMNGTRFNVCFYDGANFATPLAYLPPKTKIANVGSTRTDKISSFRTVVC